MATAANIATPAEPIGITTWLRFLVGSREAILQVAQSRQALWLGLAFVLSAGFPREYDGADLWHEPWHLFLPLVASLGTSMVLYLLLRIFAVERLAGGLGFWAGYRTLLTFFWLTAPLAWLYAIPVERFMTPGNATAANLWLLAAVSLWRVLLTSRALSVWWNANFVLMLLIVMFFADSVAIVLTFILPTPIFDLMGGIRMSESDAVLAGTVFAVQFFGIVGWFVLLLAAAIAAGVSNSPWSMAAEPISSSPIAKSLWGLTIAMFALGFALLPIGQPEQQRAYMASKLLRANELEAAVNYMAQFPRDSFPPIWDPPPRLGYGESSPDVVNVLTTIDQYDVPDWITDIFVDKLRHDPLRWFRRARRAGSTEFERVLAAYETYVPVDSIDPYDRRALRHILDSEELSSELLERTKQYLDDGESVTDE